MGVERLAAHRPGTCWSGAPSSRIERGRRDQSRPGGRPRTEWLDDIMAEIARGCDRARRQEGVDYWRVGDRGGVYLHRGLSLLECLTPWLVVHIARQ